MLGSWNLTASASASAAGCWLAGPENRTRLCSAVFQFPPHPFLAGCRSCRPPSRSATCLTQNDPHDLHGTETGTPARRHALHDALYTPFVPVSSRLKTPGKQDDLLSSSRSTHAFDGPVRRGNGFDAMDKHAILSHWHADMIMMSNESVPQQSHYAQSLFLCCRQSDALQFAQGPLSPNLCVYAT